MRRKHASRGDHVRHMGIVHLLDQVFVFDGVHRTLRANCGYEWNRSRPAKRTAEVLNCLGCIAEGELPPF